MTPSNPSNSQPLIYRIMDALGVSHLVACVNHTHAQSEIEGLSTTLAGKADRIHSHASIDAGEAIVTVDGSGEVKLQGEQITLKLENETAVEIGDTNISNLRRALSVPDSTPTASSNNLVTSGGVKAALDELIEINARETPTIDTGSFQEGKKYQVVVYNPIEGNRVHEYFYSSSASEVLYMTSDPELISQHYFAMLVWRGEETGVLHVVYQGEFITVAINA